MTHIQALVLGVIQGITEFLPVSSSGHLIFVPKLLGWADQGVMFDIVVHVGTLLAVVIVFRKKLWLCITSVFAPAPANIAYRKLAFFLPFTVIPAGIVGLVYDDAFRSATVVGVSMIMWGGLLYVADVIGKQRQITGKGLSDMTRMNWRHVLALSCAQAIAIIPGTSRSGITMTTGMFMGMDRKNAAEWSFLMSVPVIALAAIGKIVTGRDEIGAMLPFDVMVIGFLAAAVSGFIAIRFLLKLLERISFLPFALYRIVIGILILVLLR